MANLNKFRIYSESEFGKKNNLLGEFDTKEEAIDFCTSRALSNGSIKSTDEQTFRTTLDKCGFSHSGYGTDVYALYEPFEE